jgi:hypothetical protein
MKKILGMEVFPKRKSDAEYVESIRTLLKRNRWFAGMQIFLSVGLLAGIWYLAAMVWPLESAMREFAEQIGPGVFIGVAVGIVLGL